MLVYRRVSPALNLSVPTHLYTWVGRDAVRVKCFAQNTTQCPRPGLEPEPLDQETSAPTMRPPHVPQPYLSVMIITFLFIPQWLLLVFYQEILAPLFLESVEAVGDLYIDVGEAYAENGECSVCIKHNTSRRFLSRTGRNKFCPRIQSQGCDLKKTTRSLRFLTMKSWVPCTSAYVNKIS